MCVVLSVGLLCSSCKTARNRVFFPQCDSAATNVMNRCIQGSDIEAAARDKCSQLRSGAFRECGKYVSICIYKFVVISVKTIIRFFITGPTVVKSSYTSAVVESGPFVFLFNLRQSQTEAIPEHGVYHQINTWYEQCQYRISLQPNAICILLLFLLSMFTVFFSY